MREFDRLLSEALNGFDNAQCPACGNGLSVAPDEPLTCPTCGYKEEPSPANQPYLPFSGRYDEKARMIPAMQVPGVNAGSGGVGGGN